MSLFNPLEDSQFSDTIEDFMMIYTQGELEANPYLKAYLVELLARWGRWFSRGRAPALCFEAACVGGLAFINKSGKEAGELTGRADAALARLLAGMVIDEVEPMARKQGGAVREKAIGIVADEFLARTVSPVVANSAKKRMKKRKTVIKVSQEDLRPLARQGLLASNSSAMPSTANTTPPSLMERRPSTSSNGEASLFFQRPAVGMIRRPSVGDNNYTNLNNPPSSSSSSSMLKQDYYDPNYRLPEYPPNMDPIPGPGSYYADTSYGRQRRKGSQDSVDTRKGSQDSTFEQMQQQYIPSATAAAIPFSRARQDSGGSIPLRNRQGSVPYNNNDLSSSSSGGDFRSRQGSVPYVGDISSSSAGGEFRTRQKFVANPAIFEGYPQQQQQPPYTDQPRPGIRSRKGSIEAPPSASSSPNAPYASFFDSNQVSDVDPRRTRKPSSSSESGSFKTNPNFNNNLSQQQQQQYGGVGYSVTESQQQIQYQGAPYLQDFPFKSRKDSLPEQQYQQSDYGSGGGLYNRARTGSIDRTNLNSSRGLEQRPMPVQGSPARRPSQKGPASSNIQQRSRFPSESNVGDPFPRGMEFDRPFLPNQPAGPPSNNSNVQQRVPPKQSNLIRPANFSVPFTNFSSPASEPPSIGRNQQSQQQPQFYSGGRRPSQDSVNFNSTGGRRPSFDDSSSIRSQSPWQREERPLRSKTPNPSDFRKSAAAAAAQSSSSAQYPPPIPPMSSQIKKPGNIS